MTVAVVYSGIPRHGIEENIEQARKIFNGADFYFGTWEQYVVGAEKFDRFPYPEINYHPYYDLAGPPEFSELLQECKAKEWGHLPKPRWLREHCLQHLAHAYMMDKVQDYDVVVRLRYDMFMHDNIDWMFFVEKVIRENRSQGFHFYSKRKSIDTTVLKRWTLDWCHSSTKNSLVKRGFNQYTAPYMPDSAVMHKPEHFNAKKVFDLWKEYYLRPAEWGWYQILVEENFNRPHVNRLLGGGYKNWDL